MKKVLGIGNALIDTLVKLEDDQFLEEMKLPKGSMQLVSQDDIIEIESKCEGLAKSMSGGGSAANTIHGLAGLGVETAFIGKVGKDELGDLFADDLYANNIRPFLLQGKSHSGHALAFVTADSERTFTTYLGAALELCPEDLQDHFFEGFDYLHVEGYLLQNHSLLKTILTQARKSGLKVSLDLASFNVVEENLDILKQWVRDYVDILFANEEEAKAFTGKEPEQALEEMAEVCEVAVVKTGKNGSLVRAGSEVYRIPAIYALVLDTTGAGDAYAAGFLYGLAGDRPLEECGRIASLMAGKVIEGMGAKISLDGWEEIRKELA
ncbi:MAG: adenosine kinase [Bacteroidales bacterium]